MTSEDDTSSAQRSAAGQPQLGSPWLRDLYDYFAPVRSEADEKGYTDDEINTWIGEALTMVRNDDHAPQHAAT